MFIKKIFQFIKTFLSQKMTIIYNFSKIIFFTYYELTEKIDRKKLMN